MLTMISPSSIPTHFEGRKTDHIQINDNEWKPNKSDNNNRLSSNLNSKPTNYGSMNSNVSSSDLSNDEANEGWMKKAYSLAGTAVSSSYSGLKWAVSSTATVGSVIYNKGTDGIVELKRKASKHKDD